MNDNNGFSPVDDEKDAGDIVTCPEFVTDDKKTNGLFSLLLEGSDVFVTAMVAVIIIFVFIFKVPTIDGASMKDTLFHGERVVISNLFYEPKYGDIVVVSRNFTNDTDESAREIMPIIKRVIATEGQSVDIRYETQADGSEVGTVYVNGEPLNEPYIKEPMDKNRPHGDIVFPAAVPKNCVFVLGDNRNNSKDSRYSSIGMIDKRYILGKAIMIVSPFNRLGKILK